MVCLEAASEHAMNEDLVSKCWVCVVGSLFACAKVMVFVLKMCGNATNLDV
jgi:hypothetical protein